MENLRLRKHTHSCIANPHTPSLAMHKDSHMVSKTKPKIRIIHIFAPEIIKTDVENFRELVQKLTGKPSGEKCCKKKKARVVVTKREQESRSSSTSGSGMSEDHAVMTMKNNNGGCWGLDLTRDKVKEEVGVCCSDESSGGYLGMFSDLEGFISEIGEFPLLPLDGTHMMQGFEEPQLL
ncbi:VQ motif-containing protein 17 [Spatholobus suberectus]|nr:VQ motif-containing protein 17 [Spatholobus suberectus]